MNVENMSLSHLETLSFSDLEALADEYGVDVPENLDRRFLIAELMELAEEDGRFSEDMIISPGKEEKPDEGLPKNYNETQICCVLRNPAWLFVFWNISENDTRQLKALGEYTLRLRVCVLANPADPVPDEAFEINVAGQRQEQYVLLPTGKKYIKVELVYVTASAGKVLAFSPVIELPQGGSLLNDYQPGMEPDFPELIRLSGMESVLMKHYKNHRQLFS